MPHPPPPDVLDDPVTDPPRSSPCDPPDDSAAPAARRRAPGRRLRRLAAPSGRAAATAAPTRRRAVAADLPPCPVDALDSANGPVERARSGTSSAARPSETLEALVDEVQRLPGQVRVKAENQGAVLRGAAAQVRVGHPDQRPAGPRSWPRTPPPSSWSTPDTVLPAQSCLDAEGLSTDGYVADRGRPLLGRRRAVPGVGQPLEHPDLLQQEPLPAGRARPREAADHPRRGARRWPRRSRRPASSTSRSCIKLDSWFIETQLTGEKVSRS